jgi:CheY-like chemotaxis protein
MKRKRVTIRFSVTSDPKRNQPNATSLAGEACPRGNDNVNQARPDFQYDCAASVRVSSQGRSSYSLLITDDDEAFRETLRSIFEPEGFHTLLAHSGEEALDILRDQRVHLAMLDQNLPCLTGLETLRIIRQVNAILPVILMTAQNTQHLLREALSAQAFCVMPKPVTRSVVVYTVHQALSRSYDPPTGILGGDMTI